MILDLSIVWLHGLGTMRQLVTFDHNSFHFLNHIQHFLSACLRGPFLPDTLCNPGSLDQLAAVPGRHQESQKWLPIEFILTGGGQMVRGGRFCSRVTGIVSMPFGLPLLLQQGWSEASTSLSKWHCAGCGMAQLSEQPSHHKQPQSLVLLTQPLQTPDVAAKSPEIRSKLTFSAYGYILVPQSALVGLSDRSAGAGTDVCIKQVNSTC